MISGPRSLRRELRDGTPAQVPASAQSAALTAAGVWNRQHRYGSSSAAREITSMALLPDARQYQDCGWGAYCRC